MTCRQISKKLSAYLDQELTLGEVKQVQEHLNTCESCRLELVELRRTRQVVAASLHEMAAPVETSAQAWNRLQSRLKVDQMPHEEKEQSWLSRLAPGWKVYINDGLIGEFVMKRKIAVMLTGVLIFGILGFFLTYRNVTPVSAKQILEKAYEVHKASNLVTGISHMKVERYTNNDAKEGKDAGTKTIRETFTDYQTGNYRVVEYLAPEMIISNIDGYDGTFKYSSEYLDRSRKNETLVVYRSPQSRDKLSVLDDMGPTISAEETFEAMRMDPNITLEAMMTASNGNMAYVLVTVHTMDKQYFKINDQVSEKKGGTFRERMVFDAETYELLETKTTLEKDGKEIITNSLQFLTREVLPKDARVIWDMSDLTGIKLVDDLDRTKGDLLPEKITLQELAEKTSTGYMLKDIPEGFNLTITAPPRQINESSYIYIAEYRNKEGDYFVIQSTGDFPEQTSEDADEIYITKNGMTATFSKEPKNMPDKKIYQFATVHVSDKTGILISSSLPRKRVKELMDTLVLVK
jgi:hypothetical protein